MAGRSDIEWTEMTWNPTTGCSKVSKGCQNCYAERLAKRLQAAGVQKYRNGFRLTLHPATLNVPLSWKKPCMIFVNSMSDLFHEDVPFEYIESVLRIIEKTPQHIYQILTKRAGRLSEIDEILEWPSNVWIGVTVESSDFLWRIDCLRKCQAAVRFLSMEPLLGPVPELDLKMVDWVIVGGESGPKARKLQSQWVKDIRDLCIREQTPFFFKQWGGFSRKRGGRLIEGRKWDQYPPQYYLSLLCA